MSSIILSDKAMSYRSSPTSSPYQFKRKLTTPTLYNSNNSSTGRNSALLDILDQAERIASMPSPKRRNTQHSGHERTTTAVTSIMGIESDETWMDFCEDLPLTTTDAEEEEDEQEQQNQ